MNLAIIANHYPVASGRYIAAALARAGFVVRTTGPARWTSVWGLTLPASCEWTPEPVGANWADVVIVADSDPAVLNSSEAFTAPVVVWGVDNHVRDYRRPWIEHYFLAHRRVSAMEWGDDCTHLPCAYDPQYFTPSRVAWTERVYDVALLGVMYPQRWAVVERLRAANLKVIAGTGLVYESYRDVHHDSRIALNLSAAGDVGQRVFEAAAMGCLVVSDPCADFEILQPDGLWLIDHDPVAEIQNILHDPQTAQAMAARGQTWASGHTWDARVMEVAAWIKNRI